MLKIISLLGFIFSPCFLMSQIMPRESCTLNYRLVGFSLPSTLPTANYTLEIAAGTFNSEDSFKKNIFQTLHSKTSKIIAEVPGFGRHYTWRAIYSSGKPGETKSGLFHFATGIIPEVDTNNTRFRILKPAVKYKDAYVFSDGTRILYDMSGNPMWYLPPIEGKSFPVADLKLSPQGTITFLAGDQAYEINYDGDVLWKAPNNGKVNEQEREHYHHEFTRLANGHYMVLGNEFVSKPSTDDPGTFVSTPFGTIIEYDSTGDVVWSWKSSKYFEESDLINYKSPNGNSMVDIHENAFFFDEKNKTIYISFKNISRVVKVKYPEGTVMNTYGEIYKHGVPESGNDLFCGQHSVNRTQNGCVFLFNNNGCGNGAMSKIKIMKEPVSGQQPMKIIWEYKCNNEHEGPVKSLSGGNVVELHDHSIFACMGSSCSKTFIVNQDKKILWSAMPEKWNGLEKKWYPVAQYRASIIENKNEMERLIWNTEISYMVQKANQVKKERDLSSIATAGQKSLH